MSITSPAPKTAARREGVVLLAGMVVLMWLINLINAADSYRLDSDGLYAHNIDRIWGIFTAPFLHASWSHLIGNTIPLVFMGLLIALTGARQFVGVTLIVIVLGGLGTWLVSPGGTQVVGASGLVFGYATYLLTRGFFDRSALEILTGIVVGVIFGGVLLASLVPHGGISWQGHLCGGIAGVIAAWLMSGDRRGATTRTGTAGRALAR
jgi:membrane associated rhomboid family serine protease